MLALAARPGRNGFHLAGHDWGAALAWYVAVWPLAFFRIRLPSAPKPSETTPRQRPEQVL